MGLAAEMYTFAYRDIFHGDNYRFLSEGIALFSGLVFLSLSCFFMFVDYVGRPRWMLKYKTQPMQNQPVSKELLMKAVKRVAFNQVFISGPCLLLTYPLMKYKGCSFSPHDLPTVWVILRDILVITLLREVQFYYLHRLTHWGPLYRHIHKVHHEFQAPMGLVSVYAHPLEHIFVNLTPVLLTPVFLGCHMATFTVWLAWAQIETIMSHSGYHFPFVQLSPEFHDYHHLKFNCNYGGIGLMDWLHGTADNFYKTEQYKRDKILLGFTPMTEQHPIKLNKHVQNGKCD